jgi:LuxR family maltose regulon positive regulatory protein
MSATHAAVVLVSAPAGYGKTTLLALSRERDERPFAWVSLDATDNDPVVLVASVLAALDHIVDLDGAIGDGLRVPEPPLEEVVLPSLADAWTAANSSFVLVLDDVHLLTDGRSHAAIAYLADRVPVGCQLVLATRTDPPMPIASWRAHGRLAEVRAAALSLDGGEARALFAAAGVSLTDDQVARLVERTEVAGRAVSGGALSARSYAAPGVRGPLRGDEPARRRFSQRGRSGSTAGRRDPVLAPHMRPRRVVRSVVQCADGPN